MGKTLLWIGLLGGGAFAGYHFLVKPMMENKPGDGDGEDDDKPHARMVNFQPPTQSAVMGG